MIPSGTKFVGINPNFPTAERKSAQNNAAQEVYTIEEILESATLQQVSDAGGLDNGSTIREGSVERFGLTGLELVCSNEKMIQWVDGREVYYSSGNPIVHVNSINDDIPNEFYDETLGIVIGSRYTVLNTGKTYICTDATTDNAVWLPMGGEYGTILDGVAGAITNVSLDTDFYSINNGVVDVTIYGTVDVDFSVVEEGGFNFTLPINTISDVLGVITFRTPNQINGIVIQHARIYSNDTSFVVSAVPFVAKFTYQAY
jgi:hypothetical protein